jgi:hypothetical protein
MRRQVVRTELQPKLNNTQAQFNELKCKTKTRSQIMKKIVLSAVALVALAAPSMAFANSLTYWDPSADDSHGEVVTIHTGADAAADAAASKADAKNYTATLSFYDPSASDHGGGAIVTKKVGTDQVLIGTHDSGAGSQAAQMQRFLAYRADAQDK